MSATGRGAVRNESDFYPTPLWCAELILRRIRMPSGSRWLEPCSGDGVLVSAIRATDPLARISTMDSRPECEQQTMAAGANSFACMDALGEKWVPHDAVFMNPPFSRATEFVKSALASSSDVVICLERIAWLCTWGKRDGRMPSLFVLPNRPSFIGSGRTDASEYAWMVWGLSSHVVEMLPSVPLEYRRQTNSWTAAK